MSKLDEQLKKIKLWQEECKLVGLFFGAISTVAVFFTRLFHGHVQNEAIKSMSPAVKELVQTSIIYQLDPVLSISGLLFLVFLGMFIYLLIKKFKKKT